MSKEREIPIPPSIFNDVIGPIMRGPSSSHCAAALRIARMCLDLAGGHVDAVDIAFDPQGSLATTHKSQGSDMGLFGGFLGFDADDERLLHGEALLQEAGISIKIEIRNIGATHPNTYSLSFRNGSAQHHVTGLSTGGGMIEVVEIDGFDVSLAGDSYVTLIKVSKTSSADVVCACEAFDIGKVCEHVGSDDVLVELTARSFLSEMQLSELRGIDGVLEIYQLHPVLPVLSDRDTSVPFQSVEEMLTTGDPEGPISDYALAYECARSGESEDAVLARMIRIIQILRHSIQQGLSGTSFQDRILGFQSGKFGQLMQAGRLLDAGMQNRMILYVTALMEVKSSMGVIVAAPTAGSCAACPGALLAAAEELDVSDEVTARTMLSAGLIGVFTAIRSSFAAEVGGCQAETGAGAAMAAAGLVEMAGGNTRQSLAAASMALQNVLGLVCDPVANRVEAPCLGRNVAAAANGLSCANMALAGFDPLIPFDQVLDAHREISESMPRSLRCTALGGLSITPASKAIEKQLENATCQGCVQC